MYDSENILTKLNKLFILYREMSDLSCDDDKCQIDDAKCWLNGKIKSNWLKPCEIYYFLSGRPTTTITITDFYFYGHKVDCKLRSHASNKLSGPPCENWLTKQNREKSTKFDLNSIAFFFFLFFFCPLPIEFCCRTCSMHR